MALGLTCRILFICTIIEVCIAEENDTVVEMVIGFPSAILCSKPTEWLKLNGTLNVKCVIEINDEINFNRTITANNIDQEGLFFDATKDFDNKTVQVSVTWNNGTWSTQFLVNLKDSFNSRKIDGVGFTKGHSMHLSCLGPEYVDELEGITYEQAQKIKSVWYKNDDEIERDHPELVYYKSKGSNFDGLRIRNTSCETPATYKCDLEYKRRRKTVKSYGICVKTAPQGHFSIRAQAEVYRVEPGETLAVSCIGDAGKQAQRGIWVFWNTTGTDRKSRLICMSRNGRKKGKRIGCGNCSCNTNISREYNYFCEPCTQKYMENKYPYVSTLVLRNISYSDSGDYSCISNAVKSSFKIIVQKQTVFKTVKQLGIIVASALAFAVFIVIVIVICRKKRVEVECVRKNLFGTPIETE